MRGGGEAVIDEAWWELAPPCLIVAPARSVHGFRFRPDIEGPIVTAAQKPLETLAAVAAPQLLRQIAINARVVHEAQREMIYSSLSVKQVAAELGIEDGAYLGRFFRKHTGQKATGFRETARRKLAG